MIYKYQYTDSEDRQTILNSNSNKILIEDQNIFEGNFLIFSDVKPLEMQLNEIKNNTDLIILKQEGII